MRSFMFRQAKHWSNLLIGGLLISLTVAACQPNTAPLPDPKTLITKAATDIKQVNSIRFKLQLTGAPAFVDFNKTIAFVSADGAYLGPDRISAKVVARLLGVPGEVEVIAVGDSQYMKNAVLTAGQWLQQEFSPGFNAERFIRSESGVAKAIEAFYDLKMEGRTSLFGTEVYHITADAKSTDIDALTFGLVRDTDVKVDIYINTKTERVEQVVLLQPGTKTATEEDTKWTLDIFDYDAAAITIIEPAVANAQATPAFVPIKPGQLLPTSPAASNTEGTPAK